MENVQKICEMQHRLDEYERFHGELFLMLYSKDVNRQFVCFDENEVPFSKEILKCTKDLLKLCSTKEK